MTSNPRITFSGGQVAAAPPPVMRFQDILTRNVFVNLDEDEAGSRPAAPRVGGLPPHAPRGKDHLGQEGSQAPQRHESGCRRSRPRTRGAGVSSGVDGQLPWEVRKGFRRVQVFATQRQSPQTRDTRTGGVP